MTELETLVAESLRDASWIVRDGIAQLDSFGTRETCIVVFDTPPPGGASSAFEQVENARRARATDAGLGVVFGAPELPRERRGDVVLLSYEELLAILEGHGHRAQRFIREYEANGLGRALVPRRATLADGREVDAFEHARAWARKKRGSLVVTGPARCGKSAFIEALRYAAAKDVVARPGGRPSLFPDSAYRSEMDANERRANAAGIAARVERIEGEPSLATVVRLREHRFVLEVDEELAGSLLTMPNVDVLTLIPPAGSDVIDVLLAGIDGSRRAHFEAALERSEDLRAVASSAPSLTTLANAARGVAFDLPDRPTDASVTAWTLALVYAYVEACLTHLSEHHYRRDELVRALEAAALSDFTGSSYEIEAYDCRPPEALAVRAWLQTSDGVRLSDVEAEIPFGTKTKLASPLVRDALLARRVVRDARLGRGTLGRLRLEAPLEALIAREIART
jgi:hypothetical protein